MGDTGNSHFIGRRYNRSQSEHPSSGASLAGTHSHGHPLSASSPQLPVGNRYYHVSGTPLRQSPDPYPSQQQLYALSSEERQFYPGPLDPGMHHSSSSGSYGTASHHPSHPHGYPSGFNHSSSSGANSMQHQASVASDACLSTGKLHITVYRAKDIEGREHFLKFGKADPYVELRLDDQRQKTKTHNGAGSNPTWGETLPFLVKTVDKKYNELSIKIFNENYKPRSDGVLGNLRILNLGQIILQNERELSAANWYPVFRHGEEKGKILLAFDFNPRSHEQIVNDLGNEVRPWAAADVKDPNNEYSWEWEKFGKGAIKIMLQGAAVGLAAAAL